MHNSLSDSTINVRAQNIAPLQEAESFLDSGSITAMPPPAHEHDFILQAIGVVFFRRSRLFFREAAFFSGGEGCEWRALRATVGERGKKPKNTFLAFSLSMSHEGALALTSPPPDFLFSSIPLNTIPPNFTKSSSRYQK